MKFVKIPGLIFSPLPYLLFERRVISSGRCVDGYQFGWLFWHFIWVKQ